MICPGDIGNGLMNMSELFSELCKFMAEKIRSHLEERPEYILFQGSVKIPRE